MNPTKEYQNMWLAFVQITAVEGARFIDLVDFEEMPKDNYIGGYVWILVKAKTINEALDLIPMGLEEKSFRVVFVDQICYLPTLIEDNNVNKEIIDEASWLTQTNFVFKICHGIWAYSE